MFILDTQKFRAALHRSGFDSIGDLASALKLHRNTIHHYLAGRPVFPRSLERVFAALNADPTSLLTSKTPDSVSPAQDIAGVIDALQEDFPDITLVLFGSRVRQKAHRYADFDLGMYRRKGMPHELYRRVRLRAAELVEDQPYRVDVVNLNRADAPFLQEISRGWLFLAGRQQDWIHLQQEAS